MQIVNISQAKKAITAAMNCTERAIMIWGQPGVGKSEIVRQIGEETSRNVYDVRLLLRDPTDIKGIPFYNAEEKTMEWAAPTEFKKMKENSILFLDEISSAPPLVQAAAYQLVLDKKIGEFELPKNTFVIGAGNRAKDNGVTYEMPSPLADRFIHIEVTPHFETWLNDYAINNLIHKDIVAFLYTNPQYFNNFEEKGNAKKKTFTTPRSWTAVDDIVKGNMDLETESILISGVIGEGISSEFNAFRDIAITLPAPRDIFLDKNDWKKKLHSQELDVSKCYSLLVSMCYWINENKDIMPDRKNEFVEKYLSILQNEIKSKKMTDEILLAGIQLATDKFKLVELEQWRKFGGFIEKYYEFIG